MRLKNIVLTSLIHDRLVYYEKLEREMNLTNNIDSQTNNIKKHLKKISKVNGMIKVWEDIIEGDTKIMKDIKEI